jgi:hypothetical protein
MAAFNRKINVEIDWMGDSAFEIHGTLDDNVHSIDSRLRVSFPDFTITDAGAEITRMPYPGFCQGATGAISGLIGERIGRGFRKRARQVLGGAESCNHLHTLVNDMAACAFQMNYYAAKRSPEAQALMNEAENDMRRRRMMVLDWMPQLRNSCYVFSDASDSLFEETKPVPADDNQTKPI